MKPTKTKTMSANKIKNPHYLNDCNHQCLIDIGYRFGLQINSDTYHALYRCYWIDSTLDEQLFAANIFLNSERTPKSNLISVHFTARDIKYHRINHPNVASIEHIVKFYHKPNQTKCMCITELSDAGDLSTKLKRLLRESKRMANSDEILNWFAQITRGLAYLHSNGISHNNLKPTKILFFYDNQTCGGFRLKITDYIESAEKLIVTTNSDTNLYKDPSLYLNKEVVKSLDSKKTDIWSLAVIVVELIIGSNQISDAWLKKDNENLSTIYIKKVENKTDDKLLIDLLGKMFDNNHEKRLSAVQVCNHEWMSIEIDRQRNEDSVIKTDENADIFIEIEDSDDKLVEDSDEELLHSPAFDSKDNYDSITEYSIIRKITKK